MPQKLVIHPHGGNMGRHKHIRRQETELKKEGLLKTHWGLPKLIIKKTYCVLIICHMKYYIMVKIFSERFPHIVTKLCVWYVCYKLPTIAQGLFEKITKIKAQHS